MKQRLIAIWQFAVALLLYPAAIIAIIWIVWTRQPAFYIGGVILLVLLFDRTWLQILRYWIRYFKQK